MAELPLHKVLISSESISPASISAHDNALLPLVAVVILNWNGRHFLEKFLPSVLTSTYGAITIIVADNASTDDSIQFVLSNFPSVEIIRNSHNGGFAKGYNDALRGVIADYYVLLNSDVEVTPGWIEPVISLMETDVLIAACQPRLLNYAQRNLFEYAGAAGGWIDRFGYPFARGRVFDNCEEDTEQYNDVQSCFWASGAAMFVRARIFKELNGFDEFFFAHQEEVDLCWRMQCAGYKIFVQPASIVYHVGGGTLPKASNDKTFLNFRNNLVMLYKNLPRSSKIWIIPSRVLLDVIAAYKELLSGNAGYFGAVAKAHLHFAKWMVMGKRNTASASNKSLHLEGVYKGSIVWDYFVQKKRTFLEIVGNK